MPCVDNADRSPGPIQSSFEHQGGRNASGTLRQSKSIDTIGNRRRPALLDALAGERLLGTNSTGCRWADMCFPYIYFNIFLYIYIYVLFILWSDNPGKCMYRGDVLELGVNNGIAPCQRLTCNKDGSILIEGWVPEYLDPVTGPSNI